MTTPDDDPTPIPVPPPELRYRVSSQHQSAEEFLAIGEWGATCIEEHLARHGLRMQDFTRVLDFGCGCGRLLRFVIDRYPGVGFSGSDVDPPAIAWCDAHLRGADFTLNQPLPPLDYADETFDFIYALSVFSHLDEDMARPWMKEMRRVLRPGGVLYWTAHGRFVFEDHKAAYSKKEVARYEREGFLYVRNIGDGVLPDWYQTAHISESYVDRAYGREFELLDYVERGHQGYQDAVLMRRPARMGGRTSDRS